MARKYTTFRYLGDEAEVAEIKRILKLHFGEKKYIKYHYSRSDRIVDLDSEKVFCDEDIDYTYEDIAFSFSHEVEIAADAIENAIWDEDNQCLNIKVVYVGDSRTDPNGVLYMGYRIVQLINLRSFCFNSVTFPKTNNRFSDLVALVKGAENIASEMQMIEDAYKTVELSTNHLIRIWLLVHCYNLFDDLYSCSKYFAICARFNNFVYRGEHKDFYEFINVAPEFRFALSDEYCAVTEEDVRWSRPASSIDRDSRIYALFSLIKTENCKRAFLNSVEMKYCRLQNPHESLDVEKVAELVDEYSDFFTAYISDAKLISSCTDVFDYFYQICSLFIKENIMPSVDGLKLLSYKKKAEKLGFSMFEYSNEMARLETKEGLLSFVKKYGG